MPALLVRNLPAALHRKLKQNASLHRRSMTQEAVSLLEKALNETAPLQQRNAPKPAATRRPITDAWLRKAVKSGRA